MYLPRGVALSLGPTKRDLLCHCLEDNKLADVGMGDRWEHSCVHGVVRSLNS